MSTGKTKTFAPPARLNPIRVAALGMIALALALGVAGVMLRRRAALREPESFQVAAPRGERAPAVARVPEGPPTPVVAPAPSAPAVLSAADSSRGRDRAPQVRHAPPPLKAAQAVSSAKAAQAAPPPNATQAVPMKPSAVSVDIGY